MDGVRDGARSGDGLWRGVLAAGYDGATPAAGRGREPTR